MSHNLKTSKQFDTASNLNRTIMQLKDKHNNDVQK